MNKTDFSILWRGCKRMAFALVTAALFALSVYGFIATATSTGYWAVILFIASVISLGVGFLFLYVQGIIRGKYAERKGEKNE